MSVPIQQHVDWIVEEAKYDYINLSMVRNAANQASDADPKLSRMERTLALLGMLLDRGFQAVELLPEGKCKPWPDQGRASILRRIEADWRALNEEGLLGFKYWFNLPDERH